MRLVVGLGNPGSEFVGTRHNIGWEVLDELARQSGWVGRPDDFNRLARSQFDGLTLDGMIAVHSGSTEKVLLLKPTTYMNLSGRAVQAAMAFYRLAAPEIMVVLDDLALPCGKLRIRKDGSSGGHNGLKDIERMLATDAYPRLRIGIDAPPPRVPGRDYVLGRFTEAQRPIVSQAVKRAVQAIETWIGQGMETAMNRYNADPESDVH